MLQYLDPHFHIPLSQRVTLHFSTIILCGIWAMTPIESHSRTREQAIMQILHPIAWLAGVLQVQERTAYFTGHRQMEVPQILVLMVFVVSIIVVVAVHHCT